MILRLACILIVFPLMCFSNEENELSPLPGKGRLVLEIDNIKRAGGIIWIGVYDSATSFLIKEKAIVKGYSVEHPGSLEASLSNLPFGTYAIALFHDENNNGEMDRNIIGIPSEPYAFSQPPRSKWRLPRFEEVQFRFQRDGQVLRTHLRKW